MADTRRSLSTLQTALADNGAGDITAQQVRDLLISTHPEQAVQAGLASAFPSSPLTGDLYNATDGSGLHRYNGASWVLAASRGLVLLEQHTASASASLDFTTAFTSAYDEYLFEIVGLIAATNATTLQGRFSSDGGSSWVSSGYKYIKFDADTGSGSGFDRSTSATSLRLSTTSLISNDAASFFSGSGRIFNPLSASAYKGLRIDFTTYGSDSVFRTGYVNGLLPSTTAMNAFQFALASGNIASGTIRMYGVGK